MKSLSQKGKTEGRNPSQVYAQKPRTKLYCQVSHNSISSETFLPGTAYLRPVFRIHDILERIRIRGSMPLTNGSGSESGSGSCFFSSLTFKMPTKKIFSFNIYSVHYFLKVHLHNFLKIKSQKESQNSRSQGFSYYFCMMTEGSGSGAGSVSIILTDGSGSRRPKNMRIRWIRIRIRNTASDPAMDSRSEKR